MDKHKVGIMMQSAKKVPISDINECITCKLCKGYFIDATTIIECLHTFCRSCIVRYLESNKYCPICDVQVHKTKPLLNIRYDKTIQDLVYKLVPRLYCNEIKRRKEYYESHPEEKPTVLEQTLMSQYEYVLAPEESINLTLKYHGCSEGVRYLRCPSAVSILHLKKLVRVKYELTEQHNIEIFYDQDCLNSSLSLMDVAYIYSWKRNTPLDLSYKIYECPAKKAKLDQAVSEDNTTNSLQNNNNWKEVELRISENGEMSITGIRDSMILDVPEDVVIAEKKDTEENQRESEEPVEEVKVEEKVKENEIVLTPVVTQASPVKKEIPGLKFIGKIPAISQPSTSLDVSVVTTTTTTTSSISIVTSTTTLPKSSSEIIITSNISIIPLPTGKATCNTTTVFSTINKSMCSTKPAEKPPVTEPRAPKRKNEDSKLEELAPAPKLPKPTILNHTIGLMNLSNNHPLKKHKLNRNGEILEKVTAGLSANNVSVLTSSKPVVVNKNSTTAGGAVKGGEQKPANTPCYAPKGTVEKNGDKGEYRRVYFDFSTLQKTTAPPTTHHPHSHQIPIITPSQLPHNQILNALHLKTTPAPNTTAPPTVAQDTPSQLPSTTAAANHDPCPAPMTIKTKPSTPIGYKTLRDPPKSWNSQINLQIAKNTIAQNRQNSGELKNVRPAKFFKGRNTMPRYLGNPASGVKPMYQVHVSPDKDKNHTENAKVEKREIKKHSIVKIDPKTLKPISEKAPETSNLSNVTVHASPQPNQEFRLNSSPGDLKINTSSVSIFNPLKLQSSPKGDRKSPKSPISPKVKATTCVTSASTPSLSPKQQRDKTNLTFTPPNPFVPNLSNPTLGPGPWGYPSYDPRVMAAYHNLWYSQRMAAGLVPTHLPLEFSLNMAAMNQKLTGVTSSSTKERKKREVRETGKDGKLSQGPVKSSVSPKGDPKKTLETALEKLCQNKAKELVMAANNSQKHVAEVKVSDKGKVEDKAADVEIVVEKSTNGQKEEKNSERIQTSTASVPDTKQPQTKKITEESRQLPPTTSTAVVNKKPAANDVKTPIVNGEHPKLDPSLPPPPSLNGKNTDDGDSSTNETSKKCSSDENVAKNDVGKCDSKNDKLVNQCSDEVVTTKGNELETGLAVKNGENQSVGA